MDFVCFSVNNWEKRRARKQQFMLLLSLREDVGKVLYIEPPLNIWRLLLFPFFELKTAENRGRWKRALAFEFEFLSEKLFLFTPIFFMPFAFRIGVIYKINLFFVCLFVRKNLKILSFKNIILWFYHPFDYPLLEWFKDRTLACFDWAEEWAEFFIEYSQTKRSFIKILEERIISRVDLVFVVSQRLLAKSRTLNEFSYQIRDGTTPEIFSSYDGSVPEDLKHIKHPIVGYGGTFYDRLDMNLIKELSEKLPECSLVFVGNIQYDRADVSELKKRANIFFLGGKPYEELPSYLMNFDVCIVPYVLSFLTPPPTKMYDYLATGKPVVSTALPELEELREWIKLADSNEQFINLVKESLTEKNFELRQKRRAKAQENSWQARADEIVKIIQMNLNNKKFSSIRRSKKGIRG